MLLPNFSAGPTVPIGEETVRKNELAYKWQKRGEETAHAGNESNFVQPIVNQHKYLRNAQ